MKEHETITSQRTLKFHIDNKGIYTHSKTKRSLIKMKVFSIHTVKLDKYQNKGYTLKGTYCSYTLTRDCGLE
jgi:hypothetical protein